MLEKTKLFMVRHGQKLVLGGTSLFFGVAGGTGVALASSNPFAAAGSSTTISSDNPLLTFINPILQIVGLAMLVIMAIRIASGYIKGQHSSMTREIIFGVIGLVLVLDPFLLGTLIGWIIGGLGGNS